MTRQEPVAEAIAWHVCGDHYDDLPESDQAQIQSAVSAVLAAIGGETVTQFGMRVDERDADYKNGCYRMGPRSSADFTVAKSPATRSVVSRQRTTFPHHVGPWTPTTDDTDTDGEGS